MYISCIYIYIYMYVCVWEREWEREREREREKRWIESNRIYVEKGETDERYVLVYLIIYSILLCRRVLTSKFLSEYKNILSKLL